MRIATIDVGTNSVLLLIAECTPQGPVALHEASTITRLGQGVDQNRRLHPQAIERTLDCLRQYETLIQKFNVERKDVVSTSAARDADGVDSFLEQAEHVLGIRPRVVSGMQEAKLTFSGALTGMPSIDEVAVYDIGGGSTEIVMGRGTTPLPSVDSMKSLDIGAVRLTERHVSHDPPTSQEIEAMGQAIDLQLAEIPKPSEQHTWIGIGGTITTLMAVHLELKRYEERLVHGLRLEREDIVELRDRLAQMPLEKRRTVPGLEPKRADVIVAGACLVERLLTWAGQSSTLVSNRGVRWGLALELCGSGGG